MAKKKNKKAILPRNPLVPKLNDHKNQAFKNKKKDQSKSICREKVNNDEIA